MNVVVLAARLTLALVFLVSAVAKLRDRAGSRRAVEDFGVPRPVVGVVAGALPPVELLCAVLLVCADPGVTVGAVLALVLLLSFTAAITANLVRGRRPDCHCFGQVGGGQISMLAVARNGALLALAGLCLVGTGTNGSVPAVVADYPASRVATAALIVLLLAAVVVLALGLRTLVGRYGAVLLRLEAVETAIGTAPRSAPSFLLPDLDGEVVALPEVLELGRPVLVAFLSATCTLCVDLVPVLAGWQADPGHPLSVVVLSAGSAQANRDKLEGADLRLLVDEDRAVAQAYDVDGTPAAVLLGVDGLIASPMAYGVDAVVALHDDVVRTVAGAHHHGPDVHQIVPRPVASGDVLPDLEVELDGAGAVALPVLATEQAVLLFWRSDCGFCAPIASDVAALEDQARVLIVTSTAIAQLRASGLSSAVVRERSGELSRALQVPGTPAAVRVRNGLVDSPMAVGGPEVLALLRASLRTPSLVDR